ncbi:hypothetical protein N8985_06245 [Glaciecola sp.]|nr:hypothetical protein [Glaciecola sp.]
MKKNAFEVCVLSIFLIFLTGCSSVKNEVGGYFFPASVGGPDAEYYEFVGYEEDSGYDLYELLDRYEHRYDHKAILVTLSSGRHADARDIVKTLNADEYYQLLQKYAVKEAAEEAERERERQIMLAEQKRQEEARAAERERRRQIQITEQKRQEEARATKREQQRQIRIAREKREAQERRQHIMNMQPVLCDNMISALNANEVRAIRQYPLNQEYRVVGIATDINVTYGDAIVIIKSDVDLWNGCSAEMASFDDAEVINIGDNIDLFCSSWKEVAGNVSFKKCRPYIKMISN